MGDAWLAEMIGFSGGELIAAVLADQPLCKMIWGAVGEEIPVGDLKHYLTGKGKIEGLSIGGDAAKGIPGKPHTWIQHPSQDRTFTMACEMGNKALVVRKTDKAMILVVLNSTPSRCVMICNQVQALVLKTEKGKYNHMSTVTSFEDLKDEGQWCLYDSKIAFEESGEGIYSLKDKLPEAGCKFAIIRIASVDENNAGKYDIKKLHNIIIKWKGLKAKKTEMDTYDEELQTAIETITNSESSVEIIGDEALLDWFREQKLLKPKH